MNIFKKILSFFKRTKETVAHVELKLQAFIKKNSKKIKLMMSLLEAIFPAGTGIKKMTCLVTNVCYAIGLEQVTPEITEYVSGKLQKLYDKFKDELDKV